MRIYKRFFLLAVGCSIAIILFLFVRQPVVSVDDYATAIVSACQSESYRPACYEREVPKLMHKVSMEDAFAVTRRIQDKDSTWITCHTVAHKLSLLESKKDSSQWKNVLMRRPFAECNYGCLHGSLIERFQNEYLSSEQIAETIPEIQDVCEPREGFSPTEIDRTMCYHGIGHLAMYMTGGKPDKAIVICEQLARRSDGRDYVKTCIEGIFMTTFETFDPDDRALVADIQPKKEDVEEFCAMYGLYWTPCRRESFRLFLDDFDNPEYAVKFCSYARNQEVEKDCFWSIMNLRTDIFFEQIDGLEKLQAYCQEFPENKQYLCFGGAAMRLVQLDPLRNVQKANDICQVTTNDMQKEQCYEDVLYYATFSFSSQAEKITYYCNALSEPWREQCLTQNY